MATAEPTVLLVTYLQDERQLYGDALRGAGFAVNVSEDPADAFDRAVARPPDVLVARMPQLGCAFDGIELARRLRGHERTRETPVVIITSLIEPAHRTAAIEAGCDAYLLLPCLPDALVAEVRSQVGRARRAPPVGSLWASGWRRSSRQP
jgi:DNA-binding response OmpR family regulator